jgi:ubiquinone/menaquinone biosynthesis C-methylase UbiE
MAKDLFSAKAAQYARFRPGYPAALIDYILGFTAEREMAWDCATGNGQAAILLAPHFKSVMATDLSQQQLRQAGKLPNVEYSVSTAEQTPFADNSFNLITIAQAYHWFNFSDFENEANRVARNGAVLAVWRYTIPECAVIAVNAAIRHFYKNVVGAWWDAERHWIDECYQTIPFNFSPLPSKPFFTSVRWSLPQLAGYIQSWSSVEHFIKARAENPVETLSAKLQSQWPFAQPVLEFRFPLFLRIGRIEK